MDLEEESDIEKIDTLEQNANDSSSEQDGEDVSSDEENSPVQCLAYYLGRNKTTKWSKKLPNKKRRVPSHNITTHFPGVRENALSAKTTLKC